MPPNNLTITTVVVSISLVLLFFPIWVTVLPSRNSEYTPKTTNSIPDIYFYNNNLQDNNHRNREFMPNAITSALPFLQ
ncbi:hypothetical protein AUEXF2481DRAFT_43752 [Aureobasidium subglaciale EXF-2481]|uniref:Uncharacterized protein n=1 Tax=Aureobasidium subglaciale (strain EXF-2481) TaxID=1043005 RepID=A0A074YY63_AURSE|nr:uncharacterized protein AUEXF2481DRAFT_43752 [Aureobasidium subglaciale EXF-2481]KEQ91811.1 hypothetical protein AUEXF2481DRAFT_43752 [Aureobasidium subglaciale EXF-2481]